MYFIENGMTLNHLNKSLPSFVAIGPVEFEFEEHQDYLNPN